MIAFIILKIVPWDLLIKSILENPFFLKGSLKTGFIKLKDFWSRLGLQNSFRIHISTLITSQVTSESQISYDLPKIAELVSDKTRTRTQAFRC